MKKVKDLKKDVFAIGLGSFFGSLFAHSFGLFWLLGILAGGAIGYLVRLLFEPSRVLFCLKVAWSKTFGWLPDPLWKERMKAALYFSLGVAGMLSSLFCFPVTLGIIFGERNYTFTKALLIYFGIHISVNLLLMIVSLTMVFFFDLVSSPQSIITDTQWSAKNLNSLAIHWFLLKYLGIGIWRSPKFLKIFIKLVHSSDLSACGLYASAGATAIFFTLPFSPLLMAAGAVVSGFVGAGMRRIVLLAFAESRA